MKTLNVPQANDLNTVRAVVNALHRGATSLQHIIDFTGYPNRHTRYRIHAARVLGFLRMEEDTSSLTVLGERLMTTTLGSDTERALYFKAVEQSQTLQVLVPDLLARSAPTRAALTERLCKISSLGTATADRRAAGLLTWRERILGEGPHPAQKAPKPSAKTAAPSTKPPAASNPYGQLSLF